MVAVVVGIASALPRVSAQGSAGPPSLEDVTDGGGGLADLSWSMANDSPAQFLGFAWDIYAGDWASHGWEGSMWYPFAATASAGSMSLVSTGGYHAWISSQYAGGDWYACDNPHSFILYGGTPHQPATVWMESLGPQQVRLHWASDIYGTWLYQIMAFSVAENAWVSTWGSVAPDASDVSVWHFISYPGTSFLNGAADFSVGAGGDYWFYICGRAWDGQTTGPFAAAYVNTADAWPEKNQYLGTYAGPAYVTATIDGMPAEGTVNCTLRIDELRNIPGTPLYTFSGELKVLGQIVVAGLFPYPVDETIPFTHNPKCVLDRSDMTLIYDDTQDGWTWKLRADVTPQSAVGDMEFSGTYESKPVDGDGTFVLTKQNP